MEDRWVFHVTRILVPRICISTFINRSVEFFCANSNVILRLCKLQGFLGISSKSQLVASVFASHASLCMLASHVWETCGIPSRQEFSPDARISRNGNPANPDPPHGNPANPDNPPPVAPRDSLSSGRNLTLLAPHRFSLVEQRRSFESHFFYLLKFS